MFHHVRNAVRQCAGLYRNSWQRRVDYVGDDDDECIEHYIRHSADGVFIHLYRTVSRSKRALS